MSIFVVLVFVLFVCFNSSTTQAGTRLSSFTPDGYGGASTHLSSLHQSTTINENGLECHMWDDIHSHALVPPFLSRVLLVSATPED